MHPDRVLAEMRSLGLEATELGPPGFLPADPAACREVLGRHGIRVIAGFMAAILHEPDMNLMVAVEDEARALAAVGAEMVVLAAALPGNVYDHHHELAGDAWRVLRETIAQVESIAAEHGLGLAFHPHAGTAVETRDQVERLMSSTDVGICLDTGHLYLGGTDPVRLAEEAGSRITHVHFKDVDLDVAALYRSHRLSYAEAVHKGMYRPLGQGGLDITAVWEGLHQTGYQGWFVLEQDTALTREPEPSGGPVVAARQSLQYFRQILIAAEHRTTANEDIGKPRIKEESL
jgi:inosose dehydratase